MITWEGKFEKKIIEVQGQTFEEYRIEKVKNI